MKIGIDGSRAFIKNRTGIEEYSYQVIKNLRGNLQDKMVVLYIRKNQKVDFEIPESWKIKVIKFPRFWTQLGLSLEMFLHPVDVLFIPAHTVPMIHPARNATRLLNNKVVWQIRKIFNNKEDWKHAHSVAGGPKNTVVTIHGLEYEFCPKSYSWWDRMYMRCSIKNSCRWASQIISVSENTKKDLMRLYDVDEKKVSVVYEGYERERNFQFPTLPAGRQVSNFQTNPNDKISNLNTKYGIRDTKYLLFIGRIEERKNIINIIKAFEILKEKYQISHKLILAGKPGYGYEHIKYEIRNTKYAQDIIELGFVSEEEKWELLKNADVFVFPTLYEGFGIPVLEAQSVGCPVIASNNSSIPEVVNGSALLADPEKPESIAENIHKLISDENLKNGIIEKGLENVKRFSWEKCAYEIAEVLLK